MRHSSFFLFLASTLVAPVAAQFAPGSLYVVRQDASNAQVISEVHPTTGAILRTFGSIPGATRGHLAFAGGRLYRAADSDHFDVLDSAGTLVQQIVPNSSATPRIWHLAPDFASSSIYFFDLFGGSNAVRHLDDPSGNQTWLTTVSFAGVGGEGNMAFGGAPGSEALLALMPRNPTIAPPGISRVARIDRAGNVTFFDSNDLLTPFIADVGDLDVDRSTGSVHVVTTTLVVSFDATGTQTGSFALADVKPTIAVSPLGELYVGRFDNDTIEVLAKDGTLQRTLHVASTNRILDVYFIPGAPAASCTFRNGSGVNPTGFVCASAPVLGAGWDSTVATTGSTVAVSLALAASPGQLPLLGGEVLVGLAPPPSFVSGTGGAIHVPIPPSLGLLGANLYTQGLRVDLVSGVPTVVLLNAQDLVLGL